MQYHKDVMDSGLTIVRVPMGGVKSSTVLALVNVGSRYEDEKVGGISHFLEHMVFKGTEKYPTAQDVASTVDAIGAEFNAFTSKEYTGYYVKSASKDIDVALDVVSDMLLTPQLREDDLEREKGVIIEEINMYEDTPMRHIGDVFEGMFYAGSPLGREVIGTRESVRGVHRQDFINHMEKWYGLANVTVMVVGDEDVVGAKEILEKTQRYFSKKTSERQQPPIQVFSSNPISNQQKLHVEYKKTEQAHFVLGFPGLKRLDDDRYSAVVLATLLGGNMSSRLFTEVREKRGLCYYVRSDKDFYHDSGFFGAAAGVDPNRVDEAIRVTYEQFLLLQNHQQPVTKNELKRAKDYTIGSLILGMEDSQSVALAYGLKQLLEGEISTLDEIIAQISVVSMEDVQRVIERLIKPEEVRLAMIGPFEDRERFGKLLGIRS